jgi:hypothetical protein
MSRWSNALPNVGSLLGKAKRRTRWPIGRERYGDAKKARGEYSLARYVPNWRLPKVLVQVRVLGPEVCKTVGSGERELSTFVGEQGYLEIFYNRQRRH